jgi:NAD+ kinase
MSTVTLVVHNQRANAFELAREASQWLHERGHEVRMPLADAEAADLLDLAVPDDKLAQDVALAVSLGGDGTMLRTVNLVEDTEVPVLGVNVGLLGYLTEVEPNAMTSALERFFAGDYGIEDRMMLSVTIRSRRSLLDGWSFRALNEAVVEKTQSGHTVRMLVRIGGEVFTSYAADGLIVATPTGSTAYSLSARGPIVSPRHRALLLTPVSPHMLFDRSLILDPGETLSLEVIGHRPATLSVDGTSVGELEEGDTVDCSPADRSARLVTFGRRNFHRILKAKFGLSDR